MNVIELADLHLEALYERDAVGLITASRDADVTPPWFHLVRTPDGNRWLLAAGLEDSRRERLAAILSVQPPTSDCADALAHPPDRDAIRVALADHEFPVREYCGPAFFFPDQLPATDRAELLTELSESAPRGPFAWLGDSREASNPIAVVRADNRDVASVCHSARSTSEVAEAGVETAEEYRGRGYGSLAVVKWAAAVRKGGRVPLYSTE